MTNATVQKKIDKLEAEVRLLKASVSSRPDMFIDERNWKKVKPATKKIRASLYKERYA